MIEFFLKHPLLDRLLKKQKISTPLGISCIWTVKEKVDGEWVEVARNKNIFVNYGLTATAGAYSNSWVPPNYLVLDGAYTTVSVQGNPGDTVIQVAARVDQTHDNPQQLVLSPGLPNSEVVTWTAVSGTTYTLDSPLVNTHPVNDPVVRNPTVRDTLANISNELQYDPVNMPSQRMLITSSYSSGLGNNTLQFFYTSGQALGYIAGIALADNPTVGLGNIHNRVVLGYNHTSANDLEIDVSITLSNS